MQVSPPEQRTDPTLPDQRTLLLWVFAARVLSAAGLLVGAALFWTTDPQLSFIVSVAVILALTLTAYGYWSVALRNNQPGHFFLVIQALTDLGLVTAFIHLSGSLDNAFPALYVLVIAIYALLLPIGTGALVPALASVLYYLDFRLMHQQQPGLGFWGQIGVFSATYAITGALATRLRVAGVKQQTLATELRRVRLEADDILRHIRSGVITVSSDGLLAFINPMAERLLGIDGAKQTGQPILDSLKIRAPELWAAMVAAIRHGHKVSRGEGLVQMENGRSFPIGLSTTTFERESDTTPSVTAIFTDISDLKRLQDLHLRAERLEAVSQLSASLAHEIRNPLASIRSSVEQLARSAHADEDDRLLAQLIVRESERLSRLLSEFLDFGRVRASRFVPVDLYAVAVATARLVREHPDCGPDVRITVNGGATLLDADEDLLNRILVNLMLNAVQAIKGAADIRVSVAPARPGDLPAGAGIDSPIRLEIKDNGPGIPEELRDRLFQPFVTGRAGGTGLGLAIVQRAVEAHRGLVLVDSRPGAGTTFTIFFPSRWSAEEAA
ncbi:MAG TPA: ATP-binding protein [Gemmatimonadales bacterium]|nr:ATP-binding protein [Gemmatimonadales bacterium]